jgi:hypothetical protein
VIVAANDYLDGPVYTGFFPLPPSILTPPTNQTVECGLNAAFAVTATGTSPLTYRWYFNSNQLSDSANITGTATSNLTLTTVSLSQSGLYNVTVANPYGSATTPAATLTVQLTNPPTLNTLSLEPDGAVSGLITGFAGPTTIQASTDLINWMILTNITLTNSPTQFTDPSNYPQRFYRAQVR